MSDYFHCSIDYLLCRSDCTNVDNHYISLKTGLSDNALKRITIKNDNTLEHDFLNSFILSDEFLEIEHNMYWIKNNCYNISNHYKAFDEITAAIKNTLNPEQLNTLEIMREQYGDKLEHNGHQIQYLIYQCNLSFGNFMNRIKETWGKETKFVLESIERPLPGLEKSKNN